jgi:hypothetical protein
VGVTRRIVFPAIRIVLWAVIAVALAKLAFAGADAAAQSDDPLQPSVEVVEPQVAVTTGTVTNTVTVSASVVADPAAQVRATMAGTVHRVLAQEGQAVAADTPVLELRSETPVEPTVTTDAETGMQTVKENKPKVRTETVRAGTAGVLHLTVLKDQVVAVGDAVGSVAPGTLSVQGTLTPDQQYRLINAPGEGTVTLKGGPAPFVCTGLRIGAAAQDPAAATDDPAAASAAAPASGTVTCSVPAGVTAFPGLGADVEIVNGTAEGALLVPVTAVQGSVQNGNVWVVAEDGSTEQRAIVLGLTDGEHVQVAEGLAEGDTVLEYAPVSNLADVDCTDPATADPAVCGG